MRLHTYCAHKYVTPRATWSSFISYTHTHTHTHTRERTNTWLQSVYVCVKLIDDRIRVFVFAPRNVEAGTLLRTGRTAVTFSTAQRTHGVGTTVIAVTPTMFKREVLVSRSLDRGISLLRFSLDSQKTILQRVYAPFVLLGRQGESNVQRQLVRRKF